MMRVTVQMFARARDLAGKGHVELDLPEGSTVGQLRQHLGNAVPKLDGLLERSAIAVNEEYLSDDAILPSNASIALIPPVSGGQ